MRPLPLTCLMLTYSLALLGPALADPVTIAGTVVGPDDKPLAGAEVWLLRIIPQPRPSRIETVATVKTDAAGKFRFEPAEPGPADKTTGGFIVFALKPPLALGSRQPVLAGAPVGPDLSEIFSPAGDMKIMCATPQPITGQIVTPEGAGIAAAVYPRAPTAPSCRRRSRPTPPPTASSC